MMNRALFLQLAVALTVALAGCGSDDPTAPTDNNDPGQNLLFPLIPSLADYGSLDSIPATSDTVVTAIELWEGTFTPAITDMFSEFSFFTDYDVPFFGTVTVSGGSYEGWASAMPSIRYFELEDDVFDLSVSLQTDPFLNGPLRFVLANNGEPTGSPYPTSNSITTATNDDGSQSYAWTIDARVWEFPFFTSETHPLEIRIPTDYVPTISQAPHLKRELYWQLSNINGSDYKILQPGYTFSEQTSYTSGVSETESYEFFWSLTTEVSGGYGPVSTSVSASVGETFGTSLEVYEETTVTITEALEAPGDQAIMATRWQLMERFTFCGADGTPLGQGGLGWEDAALVVPGENRIFIEDYHGQ